MSRKKKTRKLVSLGPKAQPRTKGSKEPQSKKKGRGLQSGQRQHAGQNDAQKKQSENPDNSPLKGSKTPVPLLQPNQSLAEFQKEAEAKNKPELEKRLMQLENDPRLNRLLDKVEQGTKLSKDDQKWFNATLDEIESLMQTLGLDLDEVDADETQP
jgi:ribosome assembly protein YihI (activator of Der GTPase)